MTDPIQSLHPGGDHLLILLLVEESGDRFPFSPFDYILLDVGDGPAIESLVSISSGVYVSSMLPVRLTQSIARSLRG